MALRAVIFDYGMVLSAAADPEAHRELVRIFGTPAEISSANIGRIDMPMMLGNLTEPATGSGARKGRA